MKRKLFAVIRHEYMTIVKQPSFWVSLLAMPVIFAIVFFIGVLTDTDQKVDLKTDKPQVTIVDDSGVIVESVAGEYGLTRGDSSQLDQLKRSVQAGELDGVIVYSKQLAESGKYMLYVDTTDKTKNNQAVISEIAKVVLQQSILEPLESQQLASIAVSGGSAEVISYENGSLARQLPEYVVPGAFLVLFYIILIFSVGYALSSVSEEKENRSIEMVLSYVKPRTLILGKLLGIILVTFTQIIIIVGLALVAYAAARALGNDLQLPIDVSDLTFVPMEILLGAGFLIVGFIFYVALMAMIGAIFPSSKEASAFSTVFFILPAVPFWGVDAIINEPSGLFAQILTYFPLTSPTTVLFRNAIGNISLAEGILSLLVLVVTASLTIVLAAKAFRLGTLEYNDRIKFGSLFK